MVSRPFVLGLACLVLLGCEVGEAVKSEKPQAENSRQSLQSVPLPQVKIVPPKEGRIRYAYNKNNQIQEIQGPGPRKVALSYDARGRLTTMKSGQSTHNYQYNRLNHLKKITDETGSTTFHAYPDGKLQATVYPDGDKVTQEYREVGGIASVKWGKHYSLDYQRDLLGYIVALKTPIGIIEIDYDHNKPFMQRKYPNGAFSQFFYNESGKATRILHVAPNKRQIFEFNYTYDDAGRLTTTHERSPNGEVSINYTYDAYGQLTHAAYSDGRLYTYEYDRHGNRLKMSGPTGTMTATYDTFDRLTTHNGQSVDHDEAGNVTSLQGKSLNYNEQDLLVQDGLNHYSYNALGLLVQESNGKEKTHFFHVMDTLPYVLVEKKGKETTKYIWADGSYFGQIKNANQTLLFFEDHLGSIRGAIDMEGNVVGVADYSPFGVPIQRIPGVRFGYAGEPQDESGKIYLRARYYDPRIGRFLSKDPVLPQIMNEAKQNRYAYVNNSPLNFKDCDGKQVNAFGCPQCYRPPLYAIQDFLNTIPNKIYFPSQELDFWPKNWENFKDWDPSSYQFPAWGDDRYQFPIGEVDLDWAALYAKQPTNFWVGHLVMLGGTLMAIPYTGAKWLSMNKIGEEIESRSKNPNYQPTHLGKLWLDDMRSGDRWKSKFKNTIANIKGAVFGYYLWTQKRANDKQKGKSKNSKDDSEDSEEVLEMDSSDILGGHDGPDGGADSGGGGPPKCPPYCGPGGGGGHGGPDGGPGGGYFSFLKTPNVGGVYLDKAAKVIGDLSSLEGVTFDPASNRLIFIGADHAQTSLPAIRIDDLAVAFRSVFGKFLEEPGVSIDPKPENPLAAKMDVKFFGGVENTHFGWVLFESDRIMKGLSLGEDNKSHEKLRVSVNGFYNLLELGNSNLGGAYKKDLWSRFWLKPDRVIIQVSKDQKTITFPDTRILVETETMRWENGSLVPAKEEKDEKAEYFAAHFTKFYDQYAKEFPVFEQLKMLANLVGLAKWLKEAQVPVDLTWLDGYEKYFETPEDTDSHSVGGRGRLPREVISVFGGADLTVQPFYAKDQDQSAEKLRSLALKAIGEEPGVVSTIMVSERKEKKRVIALPTSQTRAPGSKFLRKWELEFIPRIFSSLHNERTVFGHSWVLDLPQLRIGQPHKGKEEYAVLNNQEIPIRTFRLTRPFGLLNLTFSKQLVDQEYQKLAFLPDQRVGIRGLYSDEKRKKFRINYDNGQKEFFNENGYLIKREFHPSSTQTFVYDSKHRLTSVQLNDDGQSQTWTFSYDETDRLVSVSNGPKTISYKYDEQGDLRKVVSGSFITEYKYDDRHLVTEILQDGRVVRKMGYNDWGQIQFEETENGQVSHPKIRREKGNTLIIEHVGDRPVTRRYDPGGRVLSVEDGSGSLVEMKYSELGVLKSIDAYNTFGDPFRLEFSANNRHEKYIDSEGNVSAFLFDELGRLQQVQDDSHALVNIEYGMTNRGNLETIETSEIKAQSLFDKQERLVEDIINSRSPLGGQIVTGFQYDHSNNVKSKTVKGLLNIHETYEKGRLIEQQLGGERSSIRYDSYGNVHGIKSDGAELSLEYAGKEKLLERLSFENGQFTTHYAFSNGSLRTRENSLGLKDQIFEGNEGKVRGLQRNDGEVWALIQDEHTLKAIRNDAVQWQFSFDEQDRLVEVLY